MIDLGGFSRLILPTINLNVITPETAPLSKEMLQPEPRPTPAHQAQRCFQMLENQQTGCTGSPVPMIPMQRSFPRRVSLARSMQYMGIGLLREKNHGRRIDGNILGSDRCVASSACFGRRLAYAAAHQIGELGLISAPALCRQQSQEELVSTWLRLATARP